MLLAQMVDARFLKALETMKRETAEAMFALTLGDSHGHARLKGMREGLDKAEAAYKKAARQDDEEMNS